MEITGTRVAYDNQAVKGQYNGDLDCICDTLKKPIVTFRKNKNLKIMVHFLFRHRYSMKLFLE